MSPGPKAAMRAKSEFKSYEVPACRHSRFKIRNHLVALCGKLVYRSGNQEVAL